MIERKESYKKTLKKEHQKIKIGFIKQESSLNKFCQINGINIGHVHQIFTGKWKGEKADALRRRLIDASKGVTNEFSGNVMGD